MSRSNPIIPAAVLHAITNAANVAAKAVETARPEVNEDLRDVFGLLGIAEQYALDVNARGREGSQRKR